MTRVRDVVRAHDLVHVVDPAHLESVDGSVLAPAARVAATASTGGTGAWVVVRRAKARPGRVPVGIRGTSRAERYAAQVAERWVTDIVRPSAIATAVAAPRAQLPAFRSLSMVARSSSLLGPDRAWGPTGSVGFELVTDSPAVSATSDLDLLIGADHPLDRAAARTWLEALSGAPSRIDAQVATPDGAFALTEWLREERGAVALRTITGPVLVDDPWAPR